MKIKISKKNFIISCAMGAVLGTILFAAIKNALAPDSVKIAFYNLSENQIEAIKQESNTAQEQNTTQEPRQIKCPNQSRQKKEEKPT